MKFYIEKNNTNYFNNIFIGIKVNAVYCYENKYIHFFKNGLRHNSKNAAFTDKVYKSFYLNNKCYGDQNTFTKQSWRRFAKLQFFK
jgi:hypothetical protein